MDTDDLIQSLAQDLTSRWPLGRAFTVATLCGVAVAGVVFVIGLGIRPDIDDALATIRFVFKFVVTGTLTVTALGLVLRLACPGAPLGPWGWAMAGAPALLVLAVVGELIAVPEAAWTARWIGSNAMLCLAAIPVLAIGPLACLIAALRYSAPMRPGLAGAVAGLAASGIAATFYASHCPDDSPLFVATWYSVATVLVGLAGSVAGVKLLKW